jgi:hypothetical protein
VKRETFFYRNHQQAIFSASHIKEKENPKASSQSKLQCQFYSPRE